MSFLDHAWTHTNSERSFLSVDGLCRSTARTGNWKCHCLCLWRKRNHRLFFWLLSAGTYLAPLRPRERNRAAHCSGSDCTDSKHREHKRVTALARGCRSSFWLNGSESPCKTINARVPNTNKYASVISSDRQAAQPCAPSGLTESTSETWLTSNGSAEAECQNTSTRHGQSN